MRECGNAGMRECGNVETVGGVMKEQDGSR